MVMDALVEISPEAADWAAPYGDDVERAWRDCPQGTWLLALAVKVDVGSVGELIGAAADCVRLTFERIPKAAEALETSLTQLESCARGDLPIASLEPQQEWGLGWLKADRELPRLVFRAMLMVREALVTADSSRLHEVPMCISDAMVTLAAREQTDELHRELEQSPLASLGGPPVAAAPFVDAAGPDALTLSPMIHAPLYHEWQRRCAEAVRKRIIWSHAMRS